MLVKKKHRALILRLRDPDKVTSVIPKSKLIYHKGIPLTVVRHGIDEVRLLRNLGIDPPHPVDYYYDWPGRYTPLHAQRETVRFLTSHSRAYCLNDLGTGKTLSTLWAFDALRQFGHAKRALVIAPLSTLERTWGDEIFRHFPHLSFSVLHGTRAQRQAALQRQADVYIINHDGIKVLLDDLCKRTDLDTVIIDELAQVARNASTLRWKVLKALIENRARVWGLTGTPTPNAPTDAWAQCRLLTPETVPAYATHFRAMTMYQVSQFNWKAKDTALQTVHEAMQPAIRFRRDDCIDLPPVMYETREVTLTKDQKQSFDEMKESFYTEYKGGQITAVNAAVKLSKLVQIACGAAYDSDGKSVVIPPKHRLRATLDLIEEAPSKVIVFVPYKAVIHVVDSIICKHHSTAVISGDVPKKDRDRIFGQFQNSTSPRVLIAQPAAMSHGLTLTAASVIVWFAPITSAEVYEQANARITRPGQKHNQLIAHIQATSVEARLFEVLKDKTTTQSTLLDLFRRP